MFVLNNIEFFRNFIINKSLFFFILHKNNLFQPFHCRIGRFTAKRVDYWTFSEANGAETIYINLSCYFKRPTKLCLRERLEKCAKFFIHNTFPLFRHFLNITYNISRTRHKKVTAASERNYSFMEKIFEALLKRRTYTFLSIKEWTYLNFSFIQYYSMEKAKQWRSQGSNELSETAQTIRQKMLSTFLTFSLREKYLFHKQVPLFIFCLFLYLFNVLPH